MDKTNAAIGLGLLAQIGPAAITNAVKTQQVQSDVSFSDTLIKSSQAKEPEAKIQEVKPSETKISEDKPSETAKADTEKNDNSVEKQNSDTKVSEVSDSEKTDTEGTKEVNAEVKSDSAEENRSDALKEKVSEAIDVIKEKIMSEFNVSEEDIEEAMEVLMLSVTDLLNGADLRDVLMQLTETTDSIELLTNVELYDSVKEVSVLAESLLGQIGKELSLTKDEVKEIISDDSFELDVKSLEEMIPVENENTGVTENEDEIVADNNITEITKAVEVTGTGTAGKSETVRDTKETANEEKPLEVTVNVENEEGTKKVETVKTETSSQNDNSKENKNSMNHENSNHAPVISQPVQQTVTTVGDIVETVTSYTDAENVLRQVTNHVKVNITADSTEMEMQLHPASLGTVNMQIASQNGEITARFTVQNELVKSILESQMISLQETLIEQGTKVNAIEITVANYNLDSGKGDSYSEERQKNEDRTSKRRGINLKELESFDELSDEERLTAEMMNMSGSSVNYKA